MRQIPRDHDYGLTPPEIATALGSLELHCPSNEWDDLPDTSWGTGMEVRYHEDTNYSRVDTA
jgi:hypothetical protein